MDLSELRRLNKTIKEQANNLEVSRIASETDAILDELGVPGNEALDIQQQQGY